MLDKKEFSRIRKDLAGFEGKREDVIQTSRNIINLSKHIIYALQRNDKEGAKSQLKDIQKLMAKLPAEPFDANIQKVAKQEFVEALVFYNILAEGRVPPAKELGVHDEDYLSGLCDLTGEVVRKAVLDAINGRYDEVKKVHAFVEEIYGEFLGLDLRNGELRKKSDSIKWNLKRLDDLLYDIAVKKHSPQ
jgi:translin